MDNVNYRDWENIVIHW